MGVIEEAIEHAEAHASAAWKTLDNPKHWGVSGSSKRIDEFVYGRSY
jgi:hypothetical protein